MACGGFTCSKNALAALNVLYIMVAFILIGVAAYAKVMAIIANIGLMGGIIACGVFLLLIAIVGLVGAIKHHQVLLFFYMIILFLLFLLQFSIACACLAMNDSQRESLVHHGWGMADKKMRSFTQYEFDCCGFDEVSNFSHPACQKSKDNNMHGCSDCDHGKPNSEAACCLQDSALNGNSTAGTCPCLTCWDKMEGPMKSATKAAGGIGLFFSFTEIIGVWLALKYRNLKDPRANPSAFL